jgi:hypothetical protein
MSGCPTLALIAATTAAKGLVDVTLKRSTSIFLTVIFSFLKLEKHKRNLPASASGAEQHRETGVTACAVVFHACLVGGL